MTLSPPLIKKTTLTPPPAQMATEVDTMEVPQNNNGPWEGPDPAATAKLFECSRIKALADERDAVQKKTFTKWVNAHLARASCRVGDLYADLRDGYVLTRLLEVLSGEQLPKPTRGRMRIHSLENVDKALQFLKEQRVHLENVGSHDIVDGNHRLTLGLIWTIILRFQIQVIKIKTEDNRETRSAKDALLLWCQMKTAGYPEVNIQNFTTSWRDGLAFNALIHKHRPDLIDFHKLTKSNATYNLQQAFNTAEQQLGLSKLLDPEDVNMEDPDEKSIITYVVSFYHYFSKMKALAVEGKRIGKVLDQAMEIEAIIERYEALAAELLAWVQHTVTIISNQKFANSLTGVQQQLQAFTAFCTLEKPVKFQEKGNLEVLLFTIQSKLRATNRKLYVPSEGKSISDINKAWSCLEKAEHEREVSLRNELIRQEKLELLAQRFDHKAAMRETWLNENQRLVSQDNFGYDLPAVEAAMKKHEAIEADISSYQERIQVVVELALEMESEGYYDTKRISAQKDNILRQWGLLTELVRARRARLEQNLALQKIFQEMVYMIDWMEEMQVLLVSKDLGKHLLEVEDLLQKHGLLEADISAQTERVQALNAAALKFSELEGYQPCDPQIICNRVNHVQTCLEELGEMAAKRRKELEDSRQLWAFFQEMEEAEAWIREKEQILAAKTCGRDLSSVLTLTTKHKSMLGELGSRRALLHQTMKRGEQILAKKRFSPGGIQEKIREVRLRWKKLEEVTGLHQQRLQEALNFFQFSAETDDLVAWLQDTYRIVSSDDFGHDDYSTQALLRKHRAVVEEVEKHRAAVVALRKQLALLAPEHRQGVDVQIRVVEVEQLYGEVAEVAVLRQQWLQDALAVYRMFSEVHACEVWVDEKEQWLERMEVPEELDEVEVVQHRFESLDQEMNSVMGRILDVNQVVQQLVEGGHPSSEEVRACQDHLNSRYWRGEGLVEHKKGQLSSVLKIQNYLLECAEMKAQVREKRKAIEATQSGGGDLGGVLALQRRLSTMEAALVVLEPRLVELQREGEALAADHPGRAMEVLLPFEEISEEWEALKRALQGCEDSLSVAGRLQQFIQDLDNFLGWLVKTQAESTLAHAELPDTVEAVANAIKKHRDFTTSMELGLHKVQLALQAGESLQRQGNLYSARVAEAMDSLRTNRRNAELAQEWMQRLQDHLELQQFLQDCHELDGWVGEKVAMAQDPAPEQRPHKRWLQHQAFMAELAQNREWLQRIEEVKKIRGGGPKGCVGGWGQWRKVWGHWIGVWGHWNEVQGIFGVKGGEFGGDLESLGWGLGALDWGLGLLEGGFGGCLEVWGGSATGTGPAQEPVPSPAAPQLWVQDRLPLATQQDLGSNLQSVQQLIKKNQVSPEAEGALDAVESWLGEQELLLMSEEKGKDEQSTLQLLKKHLQTEQTVENYEESIAQLSRQCRALLELGHPQSEQVSRRQSQVDRLYVSLKELVEERKGKLEQQYWLYQLGREVGELEHWIAEKEVVAGSPELGQDYEHVTLLQEKFLEFASETGSVGQERISAVNQMVDELIDYGHADAATIAEWKDGVNEAWADLLELMETRAQLLAASHELHKFFSDCKDLLGQIEEKRRRLPELAAKEAPRASAGALQRALGAFEHDVEVLVGQIRQLQEGAAQLRTVYAGDNAEAIASREQEVLSAWKELLGACEECRLHVASAADRVRFAGTVRDLVSWMDGVLCQIGAGEKPRDVSSVEVLMNFHQGLKSEMEARSKSIAACLELGKTLILAKSPAADEIKALAEKLLAKKKELAEKWDKHWEWLQQMLEVHQFAQEAVVADAWLTAQEPLLKSQELGSSVDEVEQLIRRHEAFRKAAAAWEERFSSLRRLTTVRDPRLRIPRVPSLTSVCVSQPRDRESPGRLPNGVEALPERTPRPDRPRARDRPKPRRRPRPKEPGQGGPGEARRSRSAPAQSSAPPPPPPTHTVQHEGFLFRKHELDGPNKKASNRSWVNLYCVLSKGDLAFYKDAKGPASGSTHGGEPPLSLHQAISEVAADYKKKKNVFKLRTGDGSEFLLQAKDEVGLRSWGGGLGGFWGEIWGVSGEIGWRYGETGGLGPFCGVLGLFGGTFIDVFG
uniref:Spectrin beta chain n=1 Tax=Cairina moschata TaxID=8855 RepID=A0A8C3CPX6_CAIMO